ncbi:MAG: arginine--tRNA ligase [Bacteroidia bacterium]|nr:arginine--tRNA ligase [Bacteroidia bacterium]
MNIEAKIRNIILQALRELYHCNDALSESLIQVEMTRPDIEGDYTVVVFPLLRFSRKSPADTGDELGRYLKNNVPEILSYQVIKGFVNLRLDNFYWISFLNEITENKDFWMTNPIGKQDTIMIEFSSPNTNKPLHLGHIRNNLIGNSLSLILKSIGNTVIKSNLVNDRGIHICKSMLAYIRFGHGETPESIGRKGDHLVGDYYVKFDQEYKKEVNDLTRLGMSEEEAANKAPLMQEAREMLRLWESNDPDTRKLWQQMNGWVYKGFAETYDRLGISFDITDYESETYHLGKQLVIAGLSDGLFSRDTDGSVWVDLTGEGLDKKILLRSDGTSVYITQDIGTANYRFNNHKPDKLIYVVGNEQNYHFQVLALIMKKLGYDWADQLYHLSYGMVELPSGRMKSREGTVVDADDIIDEMIDTAAKISAELGKLNELNEDDKTRIIKTIALGALKYFILKVDPKKNMTFIPEESIDFNGNTGPFIQYTFARICSVLRKAEDLNIITGHISVQQLPLNKRETGLIKLAHSFRSVVSDSASDMNPALIANFCYELAREYNQFYHDYPVIKEENEDYRKFRLNLSAAVASILRSGMGLLGIEMPEKM